MRKLPNRKVNLLGAGCHGGLPYQIGGKPLLDFSSNVNPLGPPTSVREALRQNLLAIAHYPDPWCKDLRGRLGECHGVDPDHIVVGNGINELIHTIARNVGADRAAIVEPAYGEYLRACAEANVRRDHWLAEGTGFELEPFDPGRADLVWLCNPNNPTGRLWPHDRLLSWIKAFPRKTFVVDESFLPFRDDESQHSLVRAAGRLKNLIVLRSLTKFYTLPGLRLGYLVANPSRYFPLAIGLPFWSVNSLAQLAGIVALEDSAFAMQTRSWLRCERNWFLRQLASFPLKLEPIPTEANFVLIRLWGIPAKVLARRLLAAGIAVREAGSFVGLGIPGQYVRVAIRTREENQQLIDALKTILTSKDEELHDPRVDDSGDGFARRQERAGRGICPVAFGARLSRRSL
jgi:threonine-phosphate decarboxylase